MIDSGGIIVLSRRFKKSMQTSEFSEVGLMLNLSCCFAFFVWFCFSFWKRCNVTAMRSGKLTHKDNADSGVQFITLVGPKQSLLLGKDPNQCL